MKIVITGGRDYSNKDKVFKVLDSLNPKKLYHGGASGADSISESWWDIRRICVREIFNADWNRLGRAAGPVRNLKMLKYAGEDAVVVAFAGGKGTENCIQYAKDLGMIVLRVEE